MFVGEEEEEDENKSNDMRMAVGRVRDVLQVLHMDNEDMMWRCVENFCRLYWWRRQRPGFKRCMHKENVALATAIWKQMVRMGMPRPIQHVVKLCGLENGGSLFRVKSVLCFNKKEEIELTGWYEYEEAPPQDYLWTLCAYLSLPFWLPACAAQLLVNTRVGSELRGSNPVHIAAGCLVSVSSKFDMFKGEVNFEIVCSALGCGVKPVKRVVDRIPPYELEFECGVDEVGHNWLMRRGRDVRASQVRPRLLMDVVKKEEEVTTMTEEEMEWKLGVRVEFKKSERQRLVEEKRRIYKERAAQRKHASQERWKHLTGLTTWLQGELAKNSDDFKTQTPTTDGWSPASCSPPGSWSSCT